MKLCILLSFKNTTLYIAHSTSEFSFFFFQLYKGRIENGTFVAIRCLALFKRYSIRNLKLRLDLLSKLRHPHLVCLLGHCIDTAQDDSNVNRVFLIYEYVANGNLRTHLSGKNAPYSVNVFHALDFLMVWFTCTFFCRTQTGESS